MQDYTEPRTYTCASATQNGALATLVYVSMQFMTSFNKVYYNYFFFLFIGFLIFALLQAMLWVIPCEINTKNLPLHISDISQILHVHSRM